MARSIAENDKRRYFFTVIHLWVVLSLCAFCFESRCFAQQLVNPREFEIGSIDFEGNESLSNRELRALLVTKETPGFLNKLLYGINERLGRKDEFFDPAVFAEDIERLHQYYVNHGFSDVQVDTGLVFSANKKQVDITVRINEDYRAIVDTLLFKGIVNVPPFVHEQIAGGRRISEEEYFDKGLVEEEIRRVLLILNNAGYYHARFLQDSSAATRYLSTRNYSIVLTFQPGKRYVWGDITTHNELDSIRTDITEEIVLRHLDYKPGDIYSQENWKNSERNLNRIGIFDLARIDIRVPAEEESSIVIKSEINVRPKDKQELAPEIALSDENNNFNLGTGIGYTNRNFLGGARTFTTRLRFRTQTLGEFPDYFVRGSGAIANVDLTFELLQPYIFSNKIKGAWTFSLILDKQKPFLQRIVRNKFGFTDRFAEFTNGFLDWTLEGVSLSRNPNFILDSTDGESRRQLELLEAQEREIQFNSIISFTIQRDKSNDVFSPSSGFIHSATFEESGLFPLLIKSGLPFTQFYRVSLLGRWYYDMTGDRFSVFAMKLRAGFEDKYGESRGDPGRVIPQTHRFYAGGGGSVRGWNSRELSATGNPQFGGNVLLEGSFEIRTNLLQSLRDDFLDKLWSVVFLDFGNVWEELRDLQLRGVGIAAGVGIRYETFFGPFRIDFGLRVYNPSTRKWITQRRFFGETFKEGVIHFGIGHAF